MSDVQEYKKDLHSEEEDPGVMKDVREVRGQLSSENKDSPKQEKTC